MPEPITIRPAQPSDAKALNQYLRTIFQEEKHLITRGDEFGLGPLRQRFWIARKLSNRFEVCLLALKGRKIVGMLESWTDRRRRVRHTTSFAMSVEKSCRREGIGKNLLLHFVDWVHKHELIDRIELHVHSDNQHAIALYKAVGFVHEGTRRAAVRYEDGRIVDDHIMALWPNQHRPELPSM